MSALKLVTDASVEPISLAEAKNFLRIDASDTSDDALISALIKAARKHAENYTQLAFINQTWDLWMNQFPGSRGSLPEWWDGKREGALIQLSNSAGIIEVPKAPLGSVTSLTTYGTDDQGTAFDTSLLQLDTYSMPGRVFLKYGQIWPTNLRPTLAVNLRFVAGYGASSANVPQDIIQAVYLLTSHFYENREIFVESRFAEIPFSVKALLDQYRWQRL